MEIILETLESNSELITLCFTIIVGFSTLVYAILTWRLVRETKRMRKSQTDPEVYLSLVQNEVSINFIDLKLENIGAGPAFNVKFKVVKDFSSKNRKISEIGYIKNGLKSFAPKHPITHYVATFNDEPELLRNDFFTIEVSFENAIGERFEREYLLEFAPYAELTKLGSPPLIDIANYLKRLEATFRGVVTGHQKLKVNTYNQQDRDNLEKAYKEHFEESDN